MKIKLKFCNWWSRLRWFSYCKTLASKNYEVYVIDNLMQGIEGASCFIGYPGYYFIKGDINDETLLSELIKKVDYVVHLAAIVGEGVKKIQI